MAVPAISGSWIYNRSWEGATSGGLNNTSPFYNQALISHFYYTVTVNSTSSQKNDYLTNTVGMYAGGASHSCKH